MPKFLGLNYVTPITIESVRRTYVSDGVNLRRQIIETDAQRWKLSITLEPTADAEGARVVGHRWNQGISGTFTVEMPQPLGITLPSSVTVGAGGASAGDASIPVSLSGNSTLRGGTFFTIGSDAKVYQAGDDRAGPGDMSITPPLQVDCSAGDTIDVTPVITVRYAPEETHTQSWQQGRLTSVTINVEEAV